MKAIFESLIEKDDIFRQIVVLYGLPEIIPSRPEGFETLVLLILEQQVSIDSAKATYLKLRTGVGAIVPQSLVALTEEEFRVYGVSRQKARYISHLALAILENRIDLESLSGKDADQVRSELIQLKGIGNWTIDVYLMFALQKPDILPLGDVAIVNTMKEFLNLQDKTQMEVYAQRWSPYRTYASFLLWHYYLKKRGRSISYQY